MALPRRLLPIAIVLGCLSIASPAMAYRAVFSVRPLAGIGAAIAEGTSIETDLILSEPLSPHATTLRPSHIRKMSQGQVVLIVGRNFERFLGKALDTYAPGKTVEAASLPGVAIESRRSFNPVHTDARGIVVPPSFPADNRDYHLWLGPDNALAIAAWLRERFSKASPAEADRFARNYATFRTAVEQARSQAAATLLPVASTPFIVYHDSYQYFDDGVRDLAQMAIVSPGESDEIGPQRLKDIEDVIASNAVSCVFFDPEEGAAWSRRFAGAHGLKAAEVDPLGQHLPIDAAYYPNLLRSVAGQFANCLDSGQ